MNGTNQRGSALAWVLIVVGTLSVLGLGYSRLASNELAIADNHRQLVDAYYVAQAGLEWGRQYVVRHATELVDCTADLVLRGKSEFVELRRGMVEVTLDKLDAPVDSYNWRLISTGYSGSAAETVTMLVRLEKHALPFQHAMALSTGLSAVPNITGDAYVEGSVELPDNPGQLKKMGVIDGVLIATGAIDENVPHTGSAVLLPNSDKQYTILDVLHSETELAQLRQQIADNCDYYFDGSFTFPENIEGIYFIEGSVNLPATVSGSGLVYTRGDIELHPNGHRDTQVYGDPDAKLVFICEGNFTIKGKGSRIVEMTNVIIAAREKLLLQGVDSQAEVYISGAVAASCLEVNGMNYQGITLEYQEDLQDYQWLPGGYGGSSSLVTVKFGNWQLESSTP